MSKQRVKLWLALPKHLHEYKEGGRAYVQFSLSTMCPPLTQEMVTDYLRWHEVEILREMPQEVEKRATIEPLYPYFE